jgi:acetone carboxylase gamma subunit
LKDLSKGTEFEPYKFQLIILKGMNPIWKYLVVSKIRKEYKEGIIGDMRLSNFKVDDKKIRKCRKGWTFKKKKNTFDVDPRIPIR